MDWPASQFGTAAIIDLGMLIQSAAVFKTKVLSLKSLAGMSPLSIRLQALVALVSRQVGMRGETACRGASAKECVAVQLEEGEAVSGLKYFGATVAWASCREFET